MGGKNVGNWGVSPELELVPSVHSVSYPYDVTCDVTVRVKPCMALRLRVIIEKKKKKLPRVGAVRLVWSGAGDSNSEVLSCRIGVLSTTTDN